MRNEYLASTPGQRLASYVQLSAREADLLGGRLCEEHNHSAQTVMRFERGAAGLRPALILSGWAGGVVLLEDGRRQIVCLAIPGDLVDPTVFDALGLTPIALTRLRTVDVELHGGDPDEQARLRALCDARRAETEVRLVRHVIRLGRLSAVERAADLLLELHERQTRVGLADARGMPLPLTQEMLADHLGLSVVHVNRVVQQLRREGLISARAARVAFSDLQALALAAGRPRPV